MPREQIEAVFENGVFRPLTPVELPEHQRVTLVLLTDERVFDEEVGYVPLPFEELKRIRVRIKQIDILAPISYPIEPEELEQE